MIIPNLNADEKKQHKEYLAECKRIFDDHADGWESEYAKIEQKIVVLFNNNIGLKTFTNV